MDDRTAGVEELELLSNQLPQEASDPASELLVTPTVSTRSSAISDRIFRPDASKLHDALEKIAWEAFSDVTERIVKELLERIERVAGQVILRWPRR